MGIDGNWENGIRSAPLNRSMCRNAEHFLDGLMPRTVIMSVLFIFLPTAKAPAQEWSRLIPSSSSVPEPRRDATAVYDPMDNAMIVFGGRTSGGVTNDVWSFNLDSLRWTNLSPPPDSASPLPRLGHTAVYDPVSHKMFVWSGQGVGFFNDTWSFDLTALRWEKHLPAPGTLPAPRYGSAAVYDPITRRLVMFAGFTNSGRFDDSQAYDIASNDWTNITPSGARPAARCLHTASYDAARRRMVMYGGQISGAQDDIWAFDLMNTTWANLTPLTRPPGRFFASSIYADDRVLVFGGTTPSGNVNELWSFNLQDSAWSMISPSGSLPSPRASHTAIYVPSDHSMIVFGGIGDSMYNNAWKLSLVVTTVRDEVRVPTGMELLQNYPNPFNPTTTFAFRIAERGLVRLTVHDVLGRQVATIVDEVLSPGPYTRDWDATGMAGGTYLYRLRSGNATSVRKTVLLQ